MPSQKPAPEFMMRAVAAASLQLNEGVTLLIVRRFTSINHVISIGFLALSFAASGVPSVASPGGYAGQDAGWTVYNGGLDGQHYSPLMQINRDNVRQLKPAWTYDTGEKGGMQTDPLVIGKMLYGITPTLKIFALDAATGSRLWQFDPGVPSGQPSRGLAYWTDGKDSRLLVGAMNYLYALHPDTGRPVEDFGDGGRIDLRKGLDDDAHYKQLMVVMTSPGILYKDLVIVGFRTSESAPAPHGDIRAFDVHTGKLRWSFHTIPHPGEEGYDTWPKDAWKTVGSANNWPGMVVDAKRGVVYVPTGSPVSDFYGADRIGNALYGDTLLALDANTGKRLWHFQGVHHDVWDRDFPSPPVLLTLHKDGREVDALAQTTKQGYLYVFDRVTGKSLFPIEERPYPASNVPGEQTSPTQPFPTLPEPFARQKLTADMLTQRTVTAHQQALQQFQEFRSDGQFVPFSVDKQTVVFPGFDGGAEWGGPAVDPKTGVLYVNANDVPWTGGLTENRAAASPGAEIYQTFCASCHGDERRGSPPAFPTLVGIHERLSDAQILAIIHNGRGRMPSFPSLSDNRLDLLLAYLKTEPQEVPRAGASVVSAPAGTDAHGSSPATPPGKEELASQEGDGLRARYRFTGYRRFQDGDGYPAVVPPWGTLNAIDLSTGKYLWKIPLGEYPELAAQGLKTTGTENYGGPVVTAGGILFIGATMFDDKIRAFDSHTGELLWEYKLPYAGVATPAVYMVNGKEYVVIAASGGRNPKEAAGGDYVAFAFP